MICSIFCVAQHIEDRVTHLVAKDIERLAEQGVVRCDAPGGRYLGHRLVNFVQERASSVIGAILLGGLTTGVALGLNLTRVGRGQYAGLLPRSAAGTPYSNPCQVSVGCCQSF